MKQIIGVAYVVNLTLRSDVVVVRRSIIARRLTVNGHGSTGIRNGARPKILSRRSDRKLELVYYITQCY